MTPTSMMALSSNSVSDGILSSNANTSSSQSFDSNNNTSSDTPSFSQVMGTYTQRHKDDDDDRNSDKQAQQSSADSQNTTPTDTTVSQDQQSSTSFTGVFGFRKREEADQDESKSGDSVESDANNQPKAAANATPGGSAPQLTAMQLLLGNTSQLTQTRLSAQANVSAEEAEAENAGAEDLKTENKESLASELAAKTAQPVVVNAPATSTAAAQKTKAPSDSKKSDKGQNAKSTQGIDLSALGLMPTDATPLQANKNGEAANAAAENANAISASAASSRSAVEASQENAQNNTAPATNFAFAMRVTSEGQNVQHEKQDTKAVSQPISSAVTTTESTDSPVAVTAAAQVAKAGDHPEEPGAAAMMYTGEQQGQTQGAGQNDFKAATNPATPVDATETDAAAGAAQDGTVKNVHLQVTGDNNQRVDIRLVDVGGEMRVSVRAGDTKLAQSLQEHIPDLTNRLDQQRFRAEVWTPRTESSSQSQQSNTNGQSWRGPSDGSGQNQSGRQQQNGRQQDQPDWLEELEGIPTQKSSLRSTL